MNTIFRRFRPLIFTSVLLMIVNQSYAQIVFQPVAVTGFNQDVVAEAGKPGALDGTSCALDASNHSIYSVSFANEYQLGGNFSAGVWMPPSLGGDPAGGLPDNGVISKGRYNFQLADYSGNNALIVSNLTGTVPIAVASGTLTFATPSNNIYYSVACFSAELQTTLKATFNFSDGTTATTATSSIPDWFSNTGFDVLVGPMGWIARTSPTLLHAGAASLIQISDSIRTDIASNSDLYAWNIMVPCASQGKFVKSITFACTGGSFGSNYRAVIMGISSAGTASTPVVSTSNIPARCGNKNGIAEVAYSSGGYKPVTFSWDSLKVTGATASGLPAGIYKCTVTDSNKCTTIVADTIVAVTAPAITVTSSAASVCAGTQVTFTATPDQNVPLEYAWNPGGATGDTLRVTPSSSGAYTVTAQDVWGCTSTASAAVAVTPDATATFTAPQAICSNSSATVTYTGDANSTATFDWNGFAGATVESGSGAGPYTIDFSQPGTYNLILSVSENGCTVIDSMPITVGGTASAPVVVTQTVTTSSVTFTWQSVPGATGYQVSINGGAYVDPSSGATGTTQVVTGLDPNTNVTISVIALGGNSCGVSTAGTDAAKTFDDAIFIPSAFTPNGDGKNDVFNVYSNQASAIELKIFNQWGQLIYSTTNLKDGWDGTFKGRVQPSGVYIYTAKITLLDGTQSTRKGPISLVR